MAQITIGCELECGLVSYHGVPVDVLASIKGGLKTGTPFEELTGDMGLHSLEFVSAVCADGRGILSSFNALMPLIPRGMTPVFCPRPFGSPVRLAKKARVRAVSDALAREHTNGASGVGKVAPWNATQYQIGAKGRSLRTDAGMAFRDFLENCGPYARIQVIERFDIEGWETHQQCWYGFSRPDRVPAPRRFSTCRELEAFIAGIPKLVTKQDGEWVVAPEGARSTLGDPESDGTLWWSARVRVWPDGSETVEWRVFESMMPDMAAQLADDVACLACDYWDYVGDHPEADWTQDVWRGLAHRHLAERHPLLVPEKPLSAEEWWKMTCL